MLWRTDIDSCVVDYKSKFLCYSRPAVCFIYCFIHVIFLWKTRLKRLAWFPRCARILWCHQFFHRSQCICWSQIKIVTCSKPLPCSDTYITCQHTYSALIRTLLVNTPTLLWYVHYLSTHLPCSDTYITCQHTYSALIRTLLLNTPTMLWYVHCFLTHLPCSDTYIAS